MKQKTLLTIILFFSIVLISTMSFAAEAMNSIKDSVRNYGTCCW